MGVEVVGRRKGGRRHVAERYRIAEGQIGAVRVGAVDGIGRGRSGADGRDDGNEEHGGGESEQPPNRGGRCRHFFPLLMARRLNWARRESRSRYLSDTALNHESTSPARNAGNAHSGTRSRSSSPAFTSGQSSSITAYQAESRRSPPRTSWCLRATPSNAAPTFSSAGRERSFKASVLNSTRRYPSSSNACRRRRYFASVFASVPQARGLSHVFPISTTRSSGRSLRKLVCSTRSPSK